MEQYVLLADYRGFKAGDVVTGYVETLPMGSYLDVNIVVDVNGQEVLIPNKFVERVGGSYAYKEKGAEALKWLGIIIVLAVLFFAAKSFLKK